MIDFPGNCNTEASRWSFCIKLNEVLRLWHNEQCLGKTAAQAESWRKARFYPKLKAVMSGRNNQIEIARQCLFWTATVPDNLSGGVVTYPVELNQDNEGSRASFLFCLESEVKGRNHDDIDVIAIKDALSQTQQDAINNTFWNPSLGDIT